MIKLLLLLVFAVSVQCWYTCDDKDFCKKIRNKDAKHHFDLLLDSVVTSDTSLEAQLKNLDTEQILALKITGLEGDIFRIQIDDPKKKRHSVPEALDGEPATNKINVITKNDINIQNGNIKATINASPFTLNVYTEHLGITINEGGKMEFVSEDGDEAIAMDFKFRGASTAYGIPEHGEKLALKSSSVGGRNPYRLYNLDYCCYDLETPDALYGSVPVLYAHGTKHTSGVFWLNSAQTFVDLNTTDDEVNAFFISESGVMDIFILPGPTLEESVKQYHKLTGIAPLPPLFSMGYQQSRWSYETQQELETVMFELDKNDFPFDVVWLDIDYADGIKYFTWNYTAFPDPIEMQSRLQYKSRKLVLIIDPHIKVEKGYFVYDEGLENGYFVQNENGTGPFEGSCWPGLSSYVDFTNPAAMEWWSELYSRFPDTFDVGIWNDMNEPSVFDVDEKTMWNSIRHHGGWTHRDIHNMYGFLQTKGTHLGLLQKDSNSRPFVLTRSHFAGTQRYSAVWTGDNVASWEHLRISIPMCLTSSLAGISFCGADVGGFVDNPTTEMFQRWYQLGAWLPFFRGHSAQGTNRREPYLYPKDVQEKFRRAIKQRYAHLPYWYTVWYEHEKFGRPVMRTMSYHYSKESLTLDMDTQFMVGRDIMVIPILNEAATKLTMYLPDDLWYNIEEDILIHGPANYTTDVTIDWSPAFYRGGSIIPRKDCFARKSHDQKDCPYNLYIYLDKTGTSAVGSLYLDDYNSFNYRKYKEFTYMGFKFENNELTANKIDEDSHYDKLIKIDTVIIYGWDNTYTTAKIIADSTTISTTVNVEQSGRGIIASGLNLDVRTEFKIQFN